MTSLAITVVGHDRPGIIAQAADVLSRCGMNLEDSSMTLLRGHFAMTLICAGEADTTEIEAALQPLVNGSLNVTVDRKSTRLNSSHLVISYAVFCLKKKTHPKAGAWLTPLCTL